MAQAEKCALCRYEHFGQCAGIGWFAAARYDEKRCAEADDRADRLGRLREIETHDSFQRFGNARQKAKPDGMKGCEIWHFIGSTVPLNEKDWDYLTTDSNSPYIAFYEASDAGKKVFYQLRWISRSDERGEWSETIEATING